MAESPSDDECVICGHREFVHDDVLWPALVDSWELDSSETAYVNVQQGTRCSRCGSNVRSQALARAIVMTLGLTGTLASAVRAPTGVRMLEINEAGTLTPWLSQLNGHIIARYPECDLTRLPYDDASFDFVVHSDTLEHVNDPMRALQECRRVLVPGGACVFTIPIIVDRMTRSREGLPPSYHGHENCVEPDFLVHTEFGADAWAMVIRAGFTSCQVVPFRFPAGVAFIARR